ncbi:MAG TPA: DUF2330 domain-containing protein [Bacteroidia bacterium]|nr:DUF2330 domain-containing protein [Bacteroidia bacterium]
MKRLLALFLAILISIESFAFCGFYVAKADVKLFNKTSQVIIAKNGEQQTVTMSSDFEGDVKDFAMVVPVPVILEEKDIRTVSRGLFDKLDTYSAPRLVEYYDENPCYYPRELYDYADESPMAMESVEIMNAAPAEDRLGVTIEAQYTIGEYDILILSAKESGGLETWLIENGYKMPVGAKEVLDPYIKTNMKFFVAKVNLGNYQSQGAVPLSPLQITYKSPKFMLPIRLGMANANGVQDLIIYLYSQTGRIETTNYRTSLIPTDFKVPLFVQSEFGEFYRDLYNKAWKREGKNVVFLEYAWEVSPMQNLFCDPCVGDPPMVSELKEAGVDWLVSKGQDYHTGGNVYDGHVYFTRMHVTYDREHFPQDLVFQETPNKQTFQGRYVLTHPASGDFTCEKGQTYIKDLGKRRWNELYTYQWLTGRDITAHYDYPKEFDVYLKKEEKGKKQGSMLPSFGSDGPLKDGQNKDSMLVFFVSLLSLAAVFFALSRKKLQTGTPK